MSYNCFHLINLIKRKPIAASKDHRDNDCVVVIVLTHGEIGRLQARDGAYDVSDIWEPFLSAPSLVGKPKLFFVQVLSNTLFF